MRKPNATVSAVLPGAIDLHATRPELHGIGLLDHFHQVVTA